jgi:hypothetical protein
MKNLTFYGTTFALVIVFCGVLLAVSFAGPGLGQSQPVSVVLSVEKQEVFLGEIVKFDLIFRNSGKTVIQIPSGGVRSGNVRVSIAKSSGEYRDYVTAEWGMKEERVVTLPPGQSVEVDSTNATILWNGIPDYSNLNVDAAKAADQGEKRILTNYAFPEAGTYFLKVTSCLIDGPKGCSIPIESNIVQIDVQEPVGDDFEVWKILKENHRLGYFLQHARFPEGIEKKSTLAKTNSVIEKYPLSNLSIRLKGNLERFILEEKQREIYTDKLKRKP